MQIFGALAVLDGESSSRRRILIERVPTGFGGMVNRSSGRLEGTGGGGGGG